MSDVDRSARVAGMLPSVHPAAERIDHVGIAVHQPDEAIEWYRRIFGMVVVNDEIVSEGLNVRLVFLAAEAEATALQLLVPVDEGIVAQHLREHGEGLHHLCLSVPDISVTLTNLQRKSGP